MPCTRGILEARRFKNWSRWSLSDFDRRRLEKKWDRQSGGNSYGHSFDWRWDNRVAVKPLISLSTRKEIPHQPTPRPRAKCFARCLPRCPLGFAPGYKQLMSLSFIALGPQMQISNDNVGAWPRIQRELGEKLNNSIGSAKRLQGRALKHSMRSVVWAEGVRAGLHTACLSLKHIRVIRRVLCILMPRRSIPTLGTWCRRKPSFNATTAEVRMGVTVHIHVTHPCSLPSDWVLVLNLYL